MNYLIFVEMDIICICTCTIGMLIWPDEYFVDCDRITGEALATMILGSYGLDLKKLPGQAYDGAGNMSGKTKGASTLITAQYPLVLYLHCAARCLNLVIVKSLQDNSKYIIVTIFDPHNII